MGTKALVSELATMRAIFHSMGKELTKKEAELRNACEHPEPKPHFSINKGQALFSTCEVCEAIIRKNRRCTGKMLRDDQIDRNNGAELKKSRGES